MKRCKNHQKESINWSLELARKGLNRGKRSRLKENVQRKQESQRHRYFHRGIWSHGKSEYYLKDNTGRTERKYWRPHIERKVFVSAQENEKRPKEVER